MVGLATFLTVVFVLSLVVRVASGAGRGRRRDTVPDVIDVTPEAPFKAGGGYPIGKIINLVTLVSFVLALLAWFGSTVRIVPANSVGVPTTFGAIGDRLEPGFHFTNPFTEVHTFSTRLQNSDMLAVVDEGDRNRDDSIEVRGSDGYQMNVDVTVRYSVESDSASALFKRVGSMDGIRDKIVRPEVREAVREVFGKYTSEDGYSTGRGEVSIDINADVKDRLARYGLLLDRVDIRNVNPEERLRTAIGDRASARE
ncbi:MAG: prohibitin family protein, partial [Acidimicrobiia bacterium]